MVAKSIPPLGRRHFSLTSTDVEITFYKKARDVARGERNVRGFVANERTAEALRGNTTMLGKSFAKTKTQVGDKCVFKHL